MRWGGLENIIAPGKIIGMRSKGRLKEKKIMDNLKQWQIKRSTKGV